MNQKEGVIIYERKKAKGTPHQLDQLNIILCNRSVGTIMGFEQNSSDSELKKETL